MTGGVMASRRGHGEGTIYQFPSGRWRAQLSVDGGRRVRKSFDTRPDADSDYCPAIRPADHGPAIQRLRRVREDHELWHCCPDHDWLVNPQQDRESEVLLPGRLRAAGRRLCEDPLRPRRHLQPTPRPEVDRSLHLEQCWRRRRAV